MDPRPNILFVFSDQQHWQAAGYLDASFRTPHLDRLAAEATVFTDAFCTTPQCSPSRSSIMTGLYPSKTGVLGNIGAAGGTPLALPTIGSVLQAAGYQMAYFGKWHLGHHPVGTAGWDACEFLAGPGSKIDGPTTERALAFLETAGTSERPFALFLSYHNPHDVYAYDADVPPSPDAPADLPDTWHHKDLSSTPGVQQQFMTDDQGRAIFGRDAAAWRRYREVYRQMVSRYDNQLGRVLDALDTHGLAEDTLCTVTSDHGDMDGQHGLIFKGPFLYEHMVRVPLVIRLPASLAPSSQGRRIDFPTVNVDLAPTMADFAGVELPCTDGVSLRPLLTGQGDMPRRQFIVGQYYSKQQWVNPIRMVRTRRAKYTRYRLHGEELYDLQSDPEEIHNVAVDPSYASLKADLADALDEWIRTRGDPFYDQAPTTRDGMALQYP
jgi:arylsulfatase A-like enzyme